MASADVFGPLGSTEPSAAGTGNYLVKFAADASPADQAAALQAVGAHELSSVDALRLHTVTLPDGAADQLRADPGVARVESEETRHATGIPNDPGYDSQWALPRIGWDQVFGSQVTGTATVALLDTGVDSTHPDLAGNVVPGTSMLDGGGDGTSDPNGHGTAMAGIVAASPDNGEGIAGVGYAGVHVMPVSVLDGSGTGQDGDIIDGVVWAADHGADVILMPFSSPDYSASLQDAIDYAWSKGAVLVAATGNDGSSAAHYPAGDRGVVGVGNTDVADALNPSSNFGPALFMAAPGTDVRTTDAGGGYLSVTGTSSSAAMVAGAAAVLKAESPDASNGVIVGRLARTADATPGNDTGNGRLDLARAFTDVSTDPVKPDGAAPLGSGGPFVGPYVAAANNDANITPEWVDGGSTTTFHTLYRVTTGGTVQHVRVTLPSGFTAISAGPTAFSSGTWGAPVVNTTNRTVDVSLTSGTGLAVGGWARIDITATAPAQLNSNGAKWLLQTFTDTAGTTGEQNDTPPVLVDDTTTPSAAITFVDAAGNPIVDPILQNGVAATVRVRVTQTGSGIKYVDVSVPTCFSSPSGVTTTVSSPPGGNGGYAPVVTDNFLRMPGGTIPTNGSLTAQFTTTPNCTSGVYTVNGSPSTNATNPPSTTNQSVSTTGGSLTVAAGLADLSITKTDSPDPVAFNGTLTYTLGVHNAGPDDASAVKVTDTLPSGVTFVSATGTNWSCNNNAGTVICSRTGGNLAAGADAPPITITVTAPNSNTTLNNSATVSSPNDNTPGNNTATASTTVGRSNLAITKTDSPDPVLTGGALGYTLNVTNNGPDQASSVSVADTLPAGTTFQNTTGTGAGWTCDHASGVVTCTRTSIAASATAPSIVINVTAPNSAGGITNSATVSSPNETDTSDNTATATTTVENVRGTKFEDVNGNGNKDAGENGLSGWTIRAYRDNGDGGGTAGDGVLQAGETTVAASATTASDGGYGLGLGTGSYVLCERIDNQANYGQSAPANTKCGALPAGQSVAPGGHALTVPAAGGSFTGRDFANYVQSSVAGTKFEDTNANGTRDTGENGLGGWVFYVDYNDNGSKDSGEPEATSSSAPAALGDYRIDGVKPGTFKVREVGQTGWSCSVPAAAPNCFYSESFTSGSQKTGKNFGNFRDASLSGVKFEDANADGSKTGDSGPSVSFDIKVFRDNGSTSGQLDGGDALVDTVATTAGTGAWSKGGLKPGSYIVCEVQKANWTQSKPDPGSSPVCGAASTGDASGGGYAVTLTSGEDHQNVDFGNYRDATLTALKYEDKNANGTQDTGEGRLSGWDFTVGSETKTTGADGKATFSVKPGSSREVCETLKSGWHNSQPGDDAHPCRTVAAADLTSGASVETPFGNYQNATLEVTKFEDRNANGTRDAGEGPLQGWDFTVGSETKTTGADGKVTFSVKPGSARQVCETLRDGWHTSGPGTDADPCGTVAAGDLESGETAKRDFGNYQDATVEVTKFEDKNANAQRDAGEGPLQGWDFTVGSETKSTGVDGKATFSVKPGSAREVCETLKDGWHNSQPGDDAHPCVTVAADDLESGESARRTFGNYRNATIEVTKYEDKNANGRRDAGEGPLSGWDFTVGSETKSTGADGKASFSVKPGSPRQVCETLKDGWHTSDPGTDANPCDTVAADDLESGETATRDFGNYRNATIEVTKYEDRNANGQRDAGEGPLSGWDFTVGSETKSTGTDGKASFSAKPGSARQVCETLKDGWHTSGPGTDADPCDTVAADDLESGETATRDFGNYQTATIELTKYEDKNANGKRDAGEPPLEGWDFTLGSETKSTGADGKASFSVKPGSAREVCETLKDGWHNSEPGSDANPCVTIAADDLESGETAKRDFGNYQDATLEVTKFEDRNADGTRDPGEGPLQGWDFFLDGNGDGIHQDGEELKTTGADGKASFPVKPGSDRRVCEVVKTDWFNSKPGGDDACYTVDKSDLDSGAKAERVFGNYQNASIEVTKYEDKNANGQRDAGEGPLQGWDFTVGSETKTSGADGKATFSVKPGSAREVCETLKDGWHNSQPGDDTTPCVTVAADDLESGEAASRNFGNYQNATVEVTKYDDRNANGTRDAGEPPLQGWEFKLGSDTKTTGADGNASFSVKPGDPRTVCETPQDGWHNSEPGSDSDPCVTVTADDLESGETAARNFGNYQNATIDVTKYRDDNANGQRDSGEPALEGWDFFLDGNGDGVHQDGEEVKTTGADGKASFSATPGSDRRVCEVTKTGWLNSEPGGDEACYDVDKGDLESGETAARAFGNYQNASIEVTKFEDKNSNGTREDGEGPLSGWDFTVGSETKSTGTDGKATFSVKPGSQRTVCETLKDGWHNSKPGDDATPCYTIDASDLDSGESAARVFGNYQNATIEVTKYEDKNANGTRDAGEGPLSGWDFTVGSETKSTGTDGKATFSVKPGSARQVCETLKDGWHTSGPGTDANPCDTVAADDLESGEKAERAFGNYQNAAVEVTKYEDKNANGQRDAGEGPLSGWDFTVGSETKSTGTDGKASFSVKPGSSRQVCETLKDGWHNSDPGSDASPCKTVSADDLESGETAARNFGNYQNATVELTKYRDDNANGSRDSGEPPLQGWDFTLGSETKTTGADGKATFSVKPGSSRQVCETPKDGWHNSDPGSDATPCKTVSADDLESGETAARAFGNYQNAALKGVKFEDRDASGTQDAGETGLNGWTIKAYEDSDGDGSLSATEVGAGAAATDTTQTANGVVGSYSLSVKPGSKYVVCEQLQTDWKQSKPANDNCKAGAPTLADGGHASGTLNSGDTVGNLDFGNYRNATVEVTKYEDKNANGSQDTGEGPLSGWAFTVGAETKTTGTDGKATFSVKPGSSREVCETLKDGWHNSDPGSDASPCKTVGADDLESGESASRVFGNYRNATIEVTKYRDDNANGQRDSGEPALEGWDFTVGSETKTTGADGKATFSVKPGLQRTVCETLKDGWHNSQPGSDANPCSTVDATDLESGESAARVFGNYQNATLGGVKFEDKNQSGAQDSGESGLNDWTIKAYKDSDVNGSLDSTELGAGASATATTATVGGVAGSYSLSVKPGAKYVVCEVLKSSWLQAAPSNDKCKAGAPTLANGGHATGALTSGQAVDNLNFGNYQRGTVSGSKFEDSDSSGTQGSGENGLGGWTIKAYADDGDGTLAAAEGGAAAAGSTTTAADGTYLLSLMPGKYVICEIAQTNWMQTKPGANTGCKNATGAAPGGYAVTVAPGSSTTSQDFGNAHFDSGSTLTDSAFKLVDDLSPWTINDFEILLNPKNVIVATNPGQFYYHQRATNTSGATGSMQFDVDWPCQFVTQTSGGQPLHAYVQLPGDAANTWRDWTPKSTNVSTQPNACAQSPDGKITVNDVPAGAKVWVTVHLDYALKDTTAPSASFGNPPILYSPFKSTATMAGGASFSSGQLLGRGKKVTVVYGRMTHKASGAPMANVWVRLTQGTNTATTTTDVDGNYVFFDSQGCDDGLVRCTGASTTVWNFAAGNNVSSKIEVMGQDASNPSPAVAWPTGKSNATVYSGNQTFATLTSTPLYTLAISKQSAYDRDWKFGP